MLAENDMDAVWRMIESWARLPTDAAKRRINYLIDQIADARARRARELLMAADKEFDGVCQGCGEYRSRLHAPDCPLAAEIAELGKKP